MDLKLINTRDHVQVPTSAMFLNSHVKVKPKPLINPVRNFDDLEESEKLQVQKWLMYCSMGTTLIDRGTRMLRDLNVIHNKNAVFNIVNAFKELRKAFSDVPEYVDEENEVDNFIYWFALADSTERKRMIKFQESIISKR